MAGAPHMRGRPAQSDGTNVCEPAPLALSADHQFSIAIESSTEEKDEKSFPNVAFFFFFSSSLFPGHS